jgi:single-strand DNA-binding protein
MVNEAQVSLTGYVATQPSFWTTSSGAPKVTMRVAWTPRYTDRNTGEWTDGHTSYVTVICWRKLADNVALCVRKGDPVVVKGRLSIRPYEKDGMPRIVVEVDASSVGHDMSRGAAHFQRTKRAPGETAAGQLATGFATGGLPGDEGLRLDDTMAGPGGNGISAEAAEPGAGSGHPDGGGAGGADSAGAGGADRADRAGGANGAGDADGPAGDDIFDESAIAALAQQPDPVSAPF